MKKIITLIIAAVMTLSLLTACGNPVYDDFENFLNVQMVDVSANYEKITAEAAKWEAMETTEELVASLKDVLIPTVEDSLTKLAAINPETEEVKNLKDKYVKIMEAYKEGFNLTLSGVETNDEEVMTKGSDKLTEGVNLLDEYNAGLEALAEEVGAEIEY